MTVISAGERKGPTLSVGGLLFSRDYRKDSDGEKWI